MVEVMIGIIMGVLGLYSIIKGKLPFIKKYNGVKNIKAHSRIEGTAVLLVGIMIAFRCLIPIKNVGLVISILLICLLALILEIVLKAI
ncbi:MAG: hypothetical protein PHY47_23095 [Lachnospiraceae bacterium]|nr:hypothetical protein [Lachnospiraceae bacterium]